MKITIDTKEDSHHDIKRVIRMLQNLVGEANLLTNTDTLSGDSPYEPPKESQSAFFNMFGENSPPAEPQTEPSDITEQEPAENEEIQVQDHPEIIPY
ncbi:MAG: hypothetical protein KAK00_02390 [Nanoarchaeota archaeon]|nr:hypothetical protein [Nanoarchaeota archaeon]